MDSLSHPGSYGHSDGWPEDPASHPGSYGYAAAWSVGLSGSYGHTAAWPEDSGPSALGNAAARLDDAATRLDLLGRRRWRRYRGSGDLADLEIAVQTLRQAVVRAPEGHPERPAFLTGLAGALLHRATRTGDARTAITAARAAVAACPGRHPPAPPSPPPARPSPTPGPHRAHRRRGRDNPPEGTRGAYGPALPGGSAHSPLRRTTPPRHPRRRSPAGTRTRRAGRDGADDRAPCGLGR
ncbi:hypothetical protein ACFSTC_18410 [Nonomuraea ferruginea]